MAQTTTSELKETILEELAVLEDDIHVTNDEDTMTFYLPTDQLNDAKEVLDTEVEVLEEHEHEYLVKISL